MIQLSSNKNYGANKKMLQQVEELRALLPYNVKLGNLPSYGQGVG